MRTYTAVIAPRYDFVTLLLTTHIQGTAPLLPNNESTLLATTSSTAFEEVFRSKYTIDTNGVITLNEIFVFVDTFPIIGPITDPNGVSRIEISGDAGQTFVNMSGDVQGPQFFQALGLWINKIDSVENGLQFRYLVKSADGLPANIYMANDYEVVLVLNKKIFI